MRLFTICSNQEGLDVDLSRLGTWSADHGLVIQANFSRNLRFVGLYKKVLYAIV